MTRQVSGTPQPGPPVTNPKLATLAPTWRRYPGVSVLLDNPGQRRPRGVWPLPALAVDEPDRQLLYDQLAAVVALAGTDEMRTRYGFCPLPRDTYHVTAWDGPNAQALTALPEPVRNPVARLLADLPDSLAHPPAELAPVLRSPLLGELPGPITCTAGRVLVAGQVLAVRLALTGQGAGAVLDAVVAARAELADRLGMDDRPWWPHVSLGYFANPDVARAASVTLPAWDRWLATRATAAIEFGSAALYGFTDMVSWFRLGP